MGVFGSLALNLAYLVLRVIPLKQKEFHVLMFALFLTTNILTLCTRSLLHKLRENGGAIQGRVEAYTECVCVYWIVDFTIHAIMCTKYWALSFKIESVVTERVTIQRLELWTAVLFIA